MKAINVLKGRLKKLEEALTDEQRIIVLDELTYYKEGNKYFMEASNEKEWIKYEIDPHKDLFEDNYEGDMVERKGINERDKVIIIVGMNKLNESVKDVVYQETYEGKTKALLKHGKAWD